MMKKLYLIACLLISVCYGQSYPGYVPNNLIDKGINFYPSTKLTPRLAEFLNMRKGTAINIGYQIFYGNIANGITPLPSSFGITSLYYDCKQWAAQLKAAGAQYCILTVSTGFGWSAFDQKTKWPIPGQVWTGGATFNSIWPSGVFLPMVEKFDIEQGGNANFFAQFCGEMRLAGIEPMIYVPIHADGMRVGTVIRNAPAALQDAYVYYLSCWLQELILRYGIRYFWFDGGNFIIPGMQQKLYNAVKSASGQGTMDECLIIANRFPGTETAGMPYDIGTFEWFIYGGNSTTFKSCVRWNGINYYIPQELVNTAAQDPTFYYQIQPGLTGFQNMINASIDTLKFQYNTAMQYGANFSLWIMPNYMGNLPTQQLQLLHDISIP